MRSILAALLKKTPCDEVGIVCNLMEGQLASPYEGIVVGFAEKMAVRAIADAYGKDASSVGAAAKKKGDAGSAAEPLANARKATLGLKEVFHVLNKLAGTIGGEPGIEDHDTVQDAQILHAARGEISGQVRVRPVKVGSRDDDSP